MRLQLRYRTPLNLTFFDYYHFFLPNNSLEQYLVQISAYNVLGESARSVPPRVVRAGNVPHAQRAHAARAEPISSTALRIHWLQENGTIIDDEGK